MMQHPKLYETPFGPWWLYETDLVCSKIRSGEGWDVWLDPVISERVRAGSTCIDVGAHVGWFTRKMLEAGAGAVLAVEPQLPLLDALVLNCAHPGLIPLPIVAAESYAISQMASPEEQLTQIVEDYHLMPSVGSIAYSPGGEGVGPFVLQVPLDWFAPLIRDLAFIKIDAQGMDFKALQGMENLLARDHPAVVFEWEPALWALHGAVLEDATGWLAARGYSSEHLSENNYLALWEGR